MAAPELLAAFRSWLLLRTEPEYPGEDVGGSIGRVRRESYIILPGWLARAG